MKNLIYILILNCFFSLTIKSQSIIAGQYNSLDYYYDFNPDNVINCGWPECVTIEFPLDLNGDGIFDVIIKGKNNSGSLGGTFTYVNVLALNNNQIALDYNDTCIGFGDCSSNIWYYKMAKTFVFNDSINENVLWSNDTLLYLYYSGSVINCFSCSASINGSSQSNIIGIRVFAQNDTLYSWIKIKSILTTFVNASFTIEEYACNKGSMNINELKNDLFFQVIPNPFNDNITFKSNYNEFLELVLYDITSSKITHIMFTKDVSLNTVKLSKGIYIFEIKNKDNVIHRGKVIKE
jgi:hypothetical protein